MRPLVFAALCAIAACPAAAERRQFGDVVYDLPAGWSVGRSDAGRQVVRFDGDDDVCPYCSLIIAPGSPAQGDLATWLRGQSLAFVDDEDRGAVQVVTQPEVVASNRRSLATMGQRVGDDLQMLFAFQAGDRFELVAFQGWAYDDEETGKTLAFLQAQVPAFVDGLQFVPAGASGVLPTAVPGSLRGLWWGWNQGFTMGLDGLMAPTMEFRTLAFWPDGRFYDGTPPAGLAPLDPAALTADIDWGTYREGDGAVDLTFADGRTERLTRGSGSDLADDDRTLSPVKPLPNGATLDGAVSSSGYVPLGPVGGAVSGGVATSSATTFHPDGTWEGTRMGVATGTFSDGAGGPATGGFTTGGHPNATSGTYAVRDGLLVMTPAGSGAATASLAFVTRDGEEMIGEEVFEPR